ncbi:ankyrin repeat domain-containing protein [Rickettsia endosymbiont of Orchestes rusci]|uniref:ankyrin repeat domain-containing protein n=1 Tax=Rickettsia endosymbiont of Orchestes rusci TaxID=3066250 RepID=UPI00313C70F0
MINLNLDAEDETDKYNWQLYYKFEEVVYKGSDPEIKKILDQFNIQDFLNIPIVFDLVDPKKIRLLKLLHKKGIPLTYEEEDGGNALHVACGAGGNLESVKFFIENNILTDIHKKSNKFGDTPLTLAISYEHHDIVDYFKQKFNITTITLEDLDVILDRVKANFRRYYKK